MEANTCNWANRGVCDFAYVSGKCQLKQVDQ